MPYPLEQSLTAVYKLYDATGTLLYVGITVDLERRFYNHERLKWWWPLVYEKKIDWMVDWDVAEAVEKYLIKTEMPLYNVRGTPMAKVMGSLPALTARRAAKAALERRINDENPGAHWTVIDDRVKAAQRAIWQQRRDTATATAGRTVVVSATGLRRRLLGWLDAAMAGTIVIVTRHGKPTTVLLPIEEYERGCRLMGQPFDLAGLERTA